MPKPPPVEHFKVDITIPIETLGPLLAQLERLGVIEYHTELVTTVRNFRNNADKGATGELLAKWVHDHPTFKAIEAVKMFEANGFTRGSTYPALGVLVEKGILKKLGEGMYSRADVKHLSPPKKQKRVAKGPHKTFSKTGKDVVLSIAKRNHGRFNVAKITEIFASEGRARNSVSTSIDQLLKTKQIKRVEPGQYVLLAKPTKPSKPQVKPAPVVNGSAVEEVVNHG